MAKTSDNPMSEVGKGCDGAVRSDEGTDAVEKGLGIEPANNGSDAVGDFHGVLLVG